MWDLHTYRIARLIKSIQVPFPVILLDRLKILKQRVAEGFGFSRDIHVPSGSNLACDFTAPFRCLILPSQSFATLKYVPSTS